MTTTHASDSTTATAGVLYLALDLGQKSWKLAFTVGLGQKPRLRTIAARDIEACWRRSAPPRGASAWPRTPRSSPATRPAATASG